MDVEQARWFQDNSIYDKLRVAIEQIRNGLSWEVFEGLEKGEVTVKIVHDGASISFHHVKAQPAPTVDAESKSFPRRKDKTT